MPQRRPARPSSDFGRHNTPDGPPRASFELTDEDVDVLRALNISSYSGGVAGSFSPTRLGGGQATTGATLSADHGSRSNGATQTDHLSEGRAFEEWKTRHPCAIINFGTFRKLLKGKRLAIFLDYDGTLTPIVSNPEDAILSDQMRAVVKTLAQHFPTAIISGRGREKVENFVKLKELYYAGSHGMDIAGPKDLPSTSKRAADGSEGSSTFQPAAHFRPIIDDVYEELCRRLADIPGSSVEHNTFCVSAHYRNCPGDTWHHVVKAVEETLACKSDELKITRGRKVMEIRPKVNWHKGTALNHLLEVLGLRHQSDVVSIYIGDDRTDEDAFRVLREGQQGYGVLVSSKMKDTTAFFTVRSPAEVLLLLQSLVDWASSSENGWLTRSASVPVSPVAEGDGGGVEGISPEASPVSSPGDVEQKQKWRQWQQGISSSGGGERAEAKQG